MTLSQETAPNRRPTHGPRTDTGTEGRRSDEASGPLLRGGGDYRRGVRLRTPPSVQGEDADNTTLILGGHMASSMEYLWHINRE